MMPKTSHRFAQLKTPSGGSVGGVAVCASYHSVLQKMQKSTISYDEYVEQIIQRQIDAGIVDTRSEFFQDAAYAMIQIQLTAIDSAGFESRNLNDIDEEEIVRRMRALGETTTVRDQINDE